MEAILPLIIQAVSGMVGGGVAGSLLKTAGMSLLPKLLSGGIGGIAGGSGLGALLGGGVAAATGDAGAAMGGLDMGSLLGNIGGGAVGGGVLTGLAGMVLGKK